MKRIKLIILNILLAAVLSAILLFFVLAFLWGLGDCNWYMPGPCPEGWDPINECIKGQDCPD